MHCTQNKVYGIVMDANWFSVYIQVPTLEVCAQKQECMLSVLEGRRSPRKIFWTLSTKSSKDIRNSVLHLSTWFTINHSITLLFLYGTRYTAGATYVSILAANSKWYAVANSGCIHLYFSWHWHLVSLLTLYRTLLV